MIECREIERPEERAAICARVLRALPGWFGIEASTAHYIATVGDRPMCAAFDGADVLGFLSLRVHNAHAAEIYVMGVLPERHRQGIGRLLIDWAKACAREYGMRYLTVKTLADAHPDEGYARTRRFYRSMGFVPLEVFETFWDENNPCLYLVTPIT